MKRNQSLRRYLVMVIFLSMAFFSFSKSLVEEIDNPDSREYAQSLNSVAALAMDWYEHLIVGSDNTAAQFSPTLWDTHRKTYPQNILRIYLTDAKIQVAESSENNSDKIALIFTLSASLVYQKNNERYKKNIVDTFSFDQIQPTQISSITHREEDGSIIVTNKDETTNKNYYQSRQFAYAWLAYMNGVSPAANWINLPNWQTSAQYDLTIGGFKTDGMVLLILPKERAELGEGRYLLREMQDKREAGASKGQITLFIDYKGLKDNLPIIANIEQVIEYEILPNGKWKVTSIKERHLLPNPQPWQKILC